MAIARVALFWRDRSVVTSDDTNPEAESKEYIDVSGSAIEIAPVHVCSLLGTSK